MTSLTSASIFRRGGPKKETEQTPADLQLRVESQDGKGGDTVLDGEEEQIVSVQELLSVISAPRSGRDFSAAIWRPMQVAAEVVISRKGTGNLVGFTWRKRHYLHPEEACYLVDRGDLMLFVEIQGQKRLLSVQEAYELMVRK
jgi:hypothetical protein